jgi:hypothetical protein
MTDHLAEAERLLTNLADLADQIKLCKTPDDLAVVNTTIAWADAQIRGHAAIAQAVYLRDLPYDLREYGIGTNRG